MWLLYNKTPHTCLATVQWGLSMCEETSVQSPSGLVQRGTPLGKRGAVTPCLPALNQTADVINHHVCVGLPYIWTLLGPELVPKGSLRQHLDLTRDLLADLPIFNGNFHWQFKKWYDTSIECRRGSIRGWRFECFYLCFPPCIIITGLGICTTNLQGDSNR